ncbi:odorant receptor 13a-like [Andrena cerasifolii]|uniref:odorant receptor 13a-like n=1 Tax=Andrena cerasifolii TaxID=2819439 RepID=UPI0040381DBC
MHHRSSSPADDHPRNCNYEADVRYTLQMCQWVLKPIGVWHLVQDQSGTLNRIASMALMTVCFSCLFFILVPCGRYIILEEKNVYTRVKLLGPIGFTLWSTIKYFYLARKGAVFARCILHMRRDWEMVEEPSHRDIMLRQATISRSLTSVCAMFLYSGGMSYNTVMPFLSKQRSAANSTVRPLMYPGYDAFLDTQSSPTYEIVFSIHVFAAFVRYTVTTAAYSLAALFVTHICGQIEIQTTRLDGLLGSRSEKASQDPLAVVIRSHVEILRFSKNVEEALQEICLAQIMESTLIICLLEYYCLMEWEHSDEIAILTYFILLTSFVFNIFIYCYIGEVLSEQCSQIGPSAYNIEWYNLPAKEARNLVLLSAISLYPPKLTAGKMMELSLNTFTIVLKTSVVYLNLLRTVTDR